MCGTEVIPGEYSTPCDGGKTCYSFAPSEHVVTFLFVLSLGHHSAGRGHCSFHPAPSGHLLVMDQLVRRRTWSFGLHRRLSAARHGAAAEVVSGVSAATQNSRTGGGNSCQSFR